MSQLPPTHYPINPNVVSGTFLATILNDTEQAIISSQSGTTAPPVALAGSFWLDTSSVSSYVLKIYTGQVWVALSTFDPATGSASAGGQAVVSVNGRIGAVRIREIYDSTESTILAQGTTDGIDLVINQDADPNANLLATMGRIAYDTTKNIFVGRNASAWVPLGGGQYTQYPNEVIADGGSIANNNVSGLQFRPISSAADITIGAVPFTIPTPLWAGGTVIAIKNSGTFTIFFADSRATASGLQTDDTLEIAPGNTIQFIFDSVTNRWYPFGGAGGGGGKWITYPLEGLANGGIIASEAGKFFQYRRINSATAIDLSTTPFGSVIVWKDGIQINVNNQGAYPITFKSGSLVQFGFDNRGLDFILPPGQIGSFQYDLISEKWFLVGSSVTSNVYSTSGGVAAGGAITILSVPFQSIKLTSTAPVVLNAVPFTIPADMPDGSQIQLIGTSDVNTITINYNATNAILFGNQTLGLNYVLNLVYDKANNYLIQVSKNY